jgi:hypothetical protein
MNLEQHEVMSGPAPEWKEFEALVKRIHDTLHKGATITSNEHLPGRLTKSRHQIDITIRYSLGGVNLLLVVECKNWNKPIDSPEVSAFAGAIRDVGADGGFMVSKMGFSEGARNMAQSENIRLFTVEDTAKRDWLEGIMVPVVFDLWALRPTHFAHVLADGSTNDLTGIDITFIDKDTMQPVTPENLLRKLWSDVPEGEKIDGKDCGGVYPLRQPEGGEVQFGFRAHKRRFWRRARLDFLGVVNAENNEAIIPSLRITTIGEAIPFPTGEIFRDTPSDLAHFGLMIASVMIQIGDVDKDLVLRKAALTVTITAGEKPLTVKLGPNYSQ